jgi:hypothetical protein
MAFEAGFKTLVMEVIVYSWPSETAWVGTDVWRRDYEVNFLLKVFSSLSYHSFLHSQTPIHFNLSKKYIRYFSLNN